MKKLRALVITKVLLLMGCWSFGQSFSCSDLSILSFSPDTADASIYQFSIQTQGTSADFINYPYISSVTDCNGNLVGTGTLFWFGQFGQTVQQYPMNINGTGSINCFPLTVSFVYQDNMGVSDTCQFIVASNTAGNVDLEELSKPEVYPNPSTGLVTIRKVDMLEPTDFTLVDISGKLLLSGTVYDSETILDLSAISPGSYFILFKSFENSPVVIYRE